MSSDILMAGPIVDNFGRNLKFLDLSRLLEVGLLFGILLLINYELGLESTCLFIDIFLNKILMFTGISFWIAIFSVSMGKSFSVWILGI